MSVPIFSSRRKSEPFTGCEYPLPTKLFIEKISLKKVLGFLCQWTIDWKEFSALFSWFFPTIFDFQHLLETSSAFRSHLWSQFRHLPCREFVPGDFASLRLLPPPPFIRFLFRRVSKPAGEPPPEFCYLLWKASPLTSVFPENRSGHYSEACRIQSWERTQTCLKSAGSWRSVLELGCEDPGGLYGGQHLRVVDILKTLYADPQNTLRGPLKTSYGNLLLNAWRLNPESRCLDHRNTLRGLAKHVVGRPGNSPRVVIRD